MVVGNRCRADVSSRNNQLSVIAEAYRDTEDETQVESSTHPCALFNEER